MELNIKHKKISESGSVEVIKYFLYF